MVDNGGYLMVDMYGGDVSDVLCFDGEREVQ